MNNKEFKNKTNDVKRRFDDKVEFANDFNNYNDENFGFYAGVNEGGLTSRHLVEMGEEFLEKAPTTPNHSNQKKRTKSQK